MSCYSTSKNDSYYGRAGSLRKPLSPGGRKVLEVHAERNNSEMFKIEGQLLCVVYMVNLSICEYIFLAVRFVCHKWGRKQV